MFRIKSLARCQSVGRTLFSKRNGESRELVCFPNHVVASQQTCIGSINFSAQSVLSVRYFSAPAAAYNQTVDVFPSIVIGSDGALSAQGPFAESQAQVSKKRHSDFCIFLFSACFKNEL